MIENPIIWMSAYWGAFTVTHVLGSHPPIRRAMISLFSLGGFKILYSLIALMTFLPLLWIYSEHKHVGQPLFLMDTWHVALNHGLMFLSVLFLVQGLITVNPLTTLAEMTKAKVSGPRGIQRWTRHPVNSAFFLFGLSHLFVNPFLGDWVFFGGFLVFVIATSLHQDYRMRKEGDEQVQDFMNQTSCLPFGAIMRGRQKWGFSEFSQMSVFVSFVLFAVLRGVHPYIFGGFAGH